MWTHYRIHQGRKGKNYLVGDRYGVVEEVEYWNDPRIQNAVPNEQDRRKVTEYIADSSQTELGGLEAPLTGVRILRGALTEEEYRDEMAHDLSMYWFANTMIHVDHTNNLATSYPN